MAYMSLQCRASSDELSAEHKSKHYNIDINCLPDHHATVVRFAIFESLCLFSSFRRRHQRIGTVGRTDAKDRPGETKEDSNKKKLKRKLSSLHCVILSCYSSL